MGILQRLLAPWREQRETPRKNWGETDISSFGGGTFDSAAGVSVSTDSAQRIAAVYACGRFLANAIAVRPVTVYRREERGRVKDRDHLVSRLLEEPNEEMTRFDFWHALIWCRVHTGNGLAFIERDSQFRPTGLIPLNPAHVQVKRTPSKALVYVLNVNGSRVGLRPDQVLHLKGPSKDGVWGLNPIQLHADGIGVAKAAETFGAGFFRRGAQPPAVLEHPGNLSNEAAARLRESWEKTYGGAENAFKTAILEEGMKLSSKSISQEAAQYIETRRFQIIEICRMYGVPPHKVYDLERATFSNIEHQAIEVDQDTIQPIVTQAELELQRKLLLEREKATHQVRFQMDAILRADTTTRGEFYSKLFMIGAIDRNEIRAFEDMPQLPDDQFGDVTMLPQNMILATLAGESASAAGASGGRAAALSHTRAALEPVLARAVDGLVTKELKALQRADDPGAWAPEFYERHRALVRESVGPVIRAAAAMLGEVDAGDPYLEAHIEAFADEYCDQAARDVAGGDPGRIADAWRGSRTDSVVGAEFDALVAWISTRKVAS